MEYQLSGIMKQEENFANLSSNTSNSTMLNDCYTYQINLGQKNQQPQPHLDDDNKGIYKQSTLFPLFLFEYLFLERIVFKRAVERLRSSL